MQVVILAGGNPAFQGGDKKRRSVFLRHAQDASKDAEQSRSTTLSKVGVLILARVAMLRNYKKDIYAILIFLALAIVVQIIHYPVGVYDLVGDLWHSGNVIAALSNVSHFTKDPHLSDVNLYRHVTGMYLYIPLVKMFNSFEQCIAFVSFALYFLGTTLLYLLIKIITDNRIVAIGGSIIFSSSTIWFFPLGEIFALVPIYGAVGKSIGYVYYLLILIIYINFRKYKFIDVVTCMMCLSMVWVHPFTFLGPCLALMTLIMVRSLIDKNYLRFAILITISLIMLMPYLVIYLGSCLAQKDIPAAAKDIIISELKNQRQLVWNPLSALTELRFTLRFTNFLNFAVFVPLILLFKGSKKYLVRFFVILSLLLFFETIILRLLGDSILNLNRVFYELNRNLKWVYFYVFLLFINFYNNIEENSSKSIRLTIFRPEYIFVFIIFFSFLLPIRATFSETNFGNKLLHKVYGLQHFSSVLHGGLNRFGIDIRDINTDAEKLAYYINRELPTDVGIAGPPWLSYKTKRGLAFNNDIKEGFFYGLRVNKYKRWLEIQELLESISSDTNVKKTLMKLKELGINYILFEKFKTDNKVGYRKYIPDERYIDFSSKYKQNIEYENNNFLLVRTSSEN